MEKIKPENILLINFGGIGDEILFLPAIISLKKAYPNAKITLALEPRSKGIKDLTNLIDNLILVDIKSKNKYFELIKLIFRAAKGSFDTVISSGASKFISIILFLTGIKNKYGYDTGKLSEFLLTKAVKLDKNQYACSMYHDLILPLTDLKTELPEITIETSQKEENTILIHPGVSKLSVNLGMIKTVTPEIWAETIDLLIKRGKKIILAGGPDDKDCIEIIRKNLKNADSQNFVDMYGKTKSLKELAMLIANAEKFLCSDSAPLHIAVGLKTDTFVIFGPTDYNKLIPKNENITPILASDNCPLKPCLWERRKTTCKELYCLKISAEDITNAILS